MSSFNDLLLVSLSDIPEQYYICNPLTRRWLALPRINLGLSSINIPCGLLCKLHQQPAQAQVQARYKYRVVLIDRRSSYFINANGQYEKNAKIFCSETGNWSESTLSFPMPTFGFGWSAHAAVASDGFLDFLLEAAHYGYRGIIAFDPFNSCSTGTDPKRCRFIDMPDGFCCRGWLASREKVCLGAVRGRLRLLKLLKRTTHFVVKIWELRYDNSTNIASSTSSWLLVHDVKLKRTETNSTTFVIDFHSSNENVVFFLCGTYICKYKIRQDKYEKVGKFPRARLDYDFKKMYIDFTPIITLVYPSWPIPIPTLPPIS